MSALTVPQIEGAFPALDRKKIQKPFVADGKNYIVDLDGPKSAYGFQRTYETFEPSLFMQSFPVGDTIFYFARDGLESFTQVTKVVWPSRQIIPVHKFISTDLARPRLNLPWSHAFVGTYHYFANRTFGVLRFDAINDNWEDVTTTIGIDDIFFITESGGRLVTLADGLTSWSAVDDGMDNVASLATGAGFQALSLVGTLEKDQDYLGLQKTAKGYLSFTSKGVLRSEIIDSISPFRHLPGEAKQKPLNPWCVTKISDTEIIMLSRHGLFTSTDGFIFEEFQPLQNEYFKLVEIPPLQQQENGFIAVYYSQARDELYCSFAQTEIPSSFTKAWVLYIKRDAWGSFNRAHRGFVFLDPELIGVDYQQAFIDSEGAVAYLDDSVVSLSIEPQNLRALYIQPTLQYEPFQLEGVNVMPTNVRLAGFSIIGYPDIAGFYEEFGVQETYLTVYATDSVVVYQRDEQMVQVEDITALSKGIAYTLTDYSSLIILGEEYHWHFNVKNYDTDQFRFQVALDSAFVAWINFNFEDLSFTSNFKFNTSFVEEADKSITFDLSWTASVALPRFAFFRFIPANVANADLFSIILSDVRLYTTANPTVNIFPDSNILTDWVVATCAYTAYPRSLPTMVHTKSSLLVLGKVAQALQQYSMDSYIEVGLFRFTDEAVNDEFSLITNVAISTLDVSESAAADLDDWFEDYPVDVFEDWLALSGFEDWGDEVISGSSYTQKIRGTLDGYTTFEDQFVDIDEVMIAGKTKFCTCANAGIFQTVRLDATEIGQSYHIKTLEFNGLIIGRL